MGPMSGAGPYAWVARELRDTPFASIAYLEETESTNADATALLGNAGFAGHTIVAEYQRRGAGRKGRSWSAAPGTALLFTTILPRDVASEALWIVPHWAALAVRAGLRSQGVAATLQWPNDLLIAERKVAGILCQSRVSGASAQVACGVGVNVHRSAAAETEIDPPPAFCDDVVPVERGGLLHAILSEYARTLTLLDQPDRVARAWEVAAGLPGARYRILKDGAQLPFDAVAQGLAGGGGLRVARADGSTETIDLADARVLRQAQDDN
jgi:BirA family transcriptional regulator, biotin operon repressor / biotin---[acetyl-CoA-carboxylase] ligase